MVVKAAEVETAVERMGAGGSTAGEVPDVEGSDRTFPHWLCHLLGRRSVPCDLNKNINTILRIFIKTLKNRFATTTPLILTVSPTAPNRQFLLEFDEFRPLRPRAFRSSFSWPVSTNLPLTPHQGYDGVSSSADPSSPSCPTGFGPVGISGHKWNAAGAIFLTNSLKNNFR